MATLYVSDLDGTLLDRSGFLSSGTREGLRELLEQQVRLTVASARSVVSIRERVDLNLPLPVVCANGTFISDLASGHHHHVFPVDEAIARTVYEEAARRKLPLMVSSLAGSDEHVYVPQVHDGGTAEYIESRVKHADPRLRFVPDVGIGLEETVTGFTCITDPAVLGPFGAWLEQTLGDTVEMHLSDDFYYPGWQWLTLHSAQASKGNAIRTLIEDFAPEVDRLVVFGDHVNDLSMFRIADHAVATSNAIPAVQEAAHEVIGRHEDDAVINWLRANAG